MDRPLLSPVEHSWLAFPQGLTRDYAFAVPPASYDRCYFPSTRDKAILGSLRGLDSRGLAKVFMYDQLYHP